MDDQERIMRYVFPGLAAILVTGIACASVAPQFICWLRGASVVELFAALVSSGGLGFLLAQCYFALDCSRVDYRRWFKERSQLLSVDTKMKHWLGKNCQADRKAAWNCGHYLWKVHVAEEHKGLDRSTGRLAARMAAIGASFLGIAVGSFVWIGVLVYVCVAGRPPSVVGWVTGPVLLGSSLALLWRAHGKLGQTIEDVVAMGLSNLWSERPQRH
jgi:hypothetical protein